MHKIKNLQKVLSYILSPFNWNECIARGLPCYIGYTNVHGFVLQNVAEDWVFKVCVTDFM